jgi:glycosyltransferase involved in cell wall biosynthesis
VRFVVEQLGARRGYAVPMILQQAGMLEWLYTDLAGNVWPGSWLVRLGPLLGFKSAAERLAGRIIPESLREKTICFGRVGTWVRTKGLFRRRNPAIAFRRQLRVSQALGRSMARRGFGTATHLYSMLGECSPLLAAANQSRIKIVTEFYIMLSTERILALEQCAFPEWAPPPPDLDAIRREFADEQTVVARTDFAVCPSEAVRVDLEENFGLRKGRATVVPYGLDAKWLKLEPRPVPGRVLFVGTAGLRKGIHYLSMAAQQLRERGRPYEFYVAGDLDLHPAAQRICRNLRLLGRIPRSSIKEEFLKADLFVLPSLAEGSAEATYEALGAGLPVITTSASGSVVRNGQEGLIVPERDALALAGAIEQVIENRQLRRRLSLAARARAREYTLERYGQRLIAALQAWK